MSIQMEMGSDLKLQCITIYIEKTGFVDLIVERKNLVSKIGTLLSILLKKNSDISAEQNETSEDSQSLTRAAS